jgi:type II secretory pathway pseudopilin PulG
MFTLDALLGLVLIVAIAGALGAVVSAQQRAAIRTGEERAALRSAEGALTQLQSHQALPAGVSIRRLNSPAPAGWVWVEATGRSGSHAALLAGLVPNEGGER